MTIQRLLDREKTEIHKSQTMPQEEKQKRLNELQNAMTSGLIRQGKVNTWLAGLTGETNWPCGNTLAKVGAFLRATQTLSKLGAASLSAVADVFIKAASMRCNGETWPGALSRSLGDYFRDYG